MKAAQLTWSWGLLFGLASCASEMSGKADANGASPNDSMTSGSEPARSEAVDYAPVPRGVRGWSLDSHRNVTLPSQSLVLSLPEAEAWISVARRGTWTGLRHEATDSEVWVRHAMARRTVTLDECEREARLSWPLIREAQDDAMERPLRAPAGYGGRLSVILLPDGGGRVEAFSVGVSRCLAIVFLTGNSPGFPERLRVGENEIIETMRVRDIDERSRVGPGAPY